MKSNQNINNINNKNYKSNFSNSSYSNYINYPRSSIENIPNHSSYKPGFEYHSNDRKTCSYKISYHEQYSKQCAKYIKEASQNNMHNSFSKINFKHSVGPPIGYTSDGVEKVDSFSTLQNNNISPTCSPPSEIESKDKPVVHDYLYHAKQNINKSPKSIESEIKEKESKESDEKSCEPQKSSSKQYNNQSNNRYHKGYYSRYNSYNKINGKHRHNYIPPSPQFSYVGYAKKNEERLCDPPKMIDVPNDFVFTSNPSVYDFERAGIIPYVILNQPYVDSNGESKTKEVIFFCLGRYKDTNDLTDFAGGPKWYEKNKSSSSDKNKNQICPDIRAAIQAATREGLEEAQYMWGPLNPVKLSKCYYVYSQKTKNFIIFVRFEVDIIKLTHSFIDRIHGLPYCEVTELVWLTLDQIYELLENREIEYMERKYKLYDQVRLTLNDVRFREFIEE